MSASLIIYIFIVQFFAFIIKGLVGFGNPLLSSPLLAMKTDNSVITPGNLLLDLPVNAWMVFKNRHSFKAKASIPVAVCCMLGAIPGTLLLKTTAPWIIKVVLGIFIIGLGIEMATRGRAKAVKEPSKVVMFAASFISGIMAGLFGVNMLFLAYMERVTVNREQFRSNVCFVFLIDNIFRTVVYAVNGLFTSSSLWLSAVSIPAALLGVLVGSRIDKYIDEKTAKNIVIAVFILDGASILIKSLIMKA